MGGKILKQSTVSGNRYEGDQGFVTSCVAVERLTCEIGSLKDQKAKIGSAALLFDDNRQGTFLLLTSGLNLFIQVFD